MSRNGAPISSGGRVLVVDDQPENLELVEEILSDEDFEIFLASDGKAALAAVEEFEPDCVVLDIMMPGLDGFSVCHRLKSNRITQKIPVVMLTALSAVDDKVTAFEVGADDFLNKPVHAAELIARVSSLVKIKRLNDELESSEAIVVSMVEMLESKLPFLAGHSERVALLAVLLGRRLGLGDESVETVAKAAVLHDLGKIGIPERLLVEDDLDAEEKRIVRHHPGLGQQILAPLSSMTKVGEIIRHHHERLDGSGYPAGLKGQDFNLEIEVVALSNRFDNLVRHSGAIKAGEILRDEAKRGLFHSDLVSELVQAAGSSYSHGGQSRRRWLDVLPVGSFQATGKILIADDTRSNREILEELLHEAGHQTMTACEGNEALRMAREESPDLVLLDVNMPGMDGYAVCTELKNDPETAFLPVVLVTAYRELRSRTMAAQAGADDFLLQPINGLELRSRVKSLLRLRRYFTDLEDYRGVILSMASALEAKDPYTKGHSDRVGTMAARLGKALDLSERDQEKLRLGGLVHDIGKIAIPESVLNKPGRLNDEEFALIRQHPVIGEQICKSLHSIRDLLPIIRHHHEHYNGGGYPDGLVGEDIPYLARVLSMVDAFDALTSPRPYRSRLSGQEAFALLTEEAERGRWDLEIFAATKKLIDAKALMPDESEYEVGARFWADASVALP